MSPEVISALIAAVVSLIASIFTLYISSRNRKIEREKLQYEKEKLEADRSRLRKELRDSATQTHLWKAEMERLKAETDKLVTESNEIRRQRLEAEREEIRDMLRLFDRAVFDAPPYIEDPIDMLKAIRQTRIALQQSGASLVRNRKVAENFRQARILLLEAEANMQEKYPELVRLIDESVDEKVDWGHRREVYASLDESPYSIIEPMMKIRTAVEVHIDQVHKLLRELDDRFEAEG